MHAPSYLLKNSFGIYHLRLAVPKHLRYLCGKREIKQSLRTGNHREALRKARKLATIYQDRFDKMSEDFDDILNDPFLKHLKVDIIKHPDGTVELKNLEMDPDKADGEMKMLDHAVANINKVVAATPTTPAPQVIQPQQVQTAPAGPSIKLQQLIDEYLEVLEGHCDNKTINGYTAHLKTFIEILGDVPINTIDRKRARGAVTILKALPPNRNKLKEFKDLSIAAIIQLKPTKKISPTTVKLYMERIVAVFQFAIEEEYLDGKNPFLNILKDKNTRRPDQERNIFEDKDLKALFDPSNRSSIPDEYPSREWIPLIAAYSGLRLEEIAQMDASDIKDYGGIWCFDINSNNGKNLKNPTADRVVPIHSKLLSNYFMLYVQGQKGKKLFPDLVKGNERFGHHFSKWFGRYRVKCGVVGEGVTFHSFRHNVATLFKQGDVDVTKAAAILGHTVDGQSYGRYGKAYKVEQLKQVIEIINYGDMIL